MKILKVIAAIVVLLILAMVAVPMLVSIDDITASLSEEVEAATGRQLVVQGDKSLSIFPSLRLQLNQVSLSNMVGGSQPDMVSMDQLDVHIPWLSLLSGELSIERFVIDKPVILLETDADGRANWDLMPADAADEDVEVTASRGLPGGFDINLGQVAIVDGALTFIDGQAGTKQQLDQLGLAIELPSLYQDLLMRGKVTYMGEVLTLDVIVSTPALAASGEDFDVNLGLNSRLMKLDYRGAISDQGGRIGGSLRLSGDSAKQLATWQGIELGAGENAFNAFDLTGDIVFSENTLRIQGLKAALDALEIEGESTLVLGEIPNITAKVDLGMLDLNPYLPPPAAGGGEPAGSPDVEAESAAPIEWDKTPVDLSALKAVNADISLASRGLRAREITLGENVLGLKLKDGKMRLSLDKFEAYGGSGKGKLDVNSNRSPYAINTKFDLSGIEAMPLLNDLVGVDKLRGTGNLSWKLRTTGSSQQDFVSRLNGDVGFSFEDGAVKGANIAAIVRSIEGAMSKNLSAVSLDSTFDNAAETDFSEMSGTLVFLKGVGKNEDLSLASPLLRVSGAGTIDLPATQLDYTVQTKLVATVQGQGATGDNKSLNIPVRISGPFHDVKIRPDISSAAKEEAVESLKKKLFKGFGNKNRE